MILQKESSSDNFSQNADVSTNSAVSYAKKTFLGPGPVSQVHYELVTPSRSISFEYPGYWGISESLTEVQTNIRLMTLIEGSGLSESSVKETEDYKEISPLSIRAVDQEYCLYRWCLLEVKSAYESASGRWDYLGDSTYCDAGYCAEYKHIYKQAHGDTVLYVVTHDPVHTAPTDGPGLYDITKTTFDSLRFEKN